MKDDPVFIFTHDDLYRAFNKGLESAVFVLERATELSPEGISKLAGALRRMIDNEAVNDLKECRNGENSCY